MKSRRYYSLVVMLLTVSVGLCHQMTSSTIAAVRYVPTTHKVVALTIDDGPHPVTTGQLLAVLQEKQVKATFFILGANAAMHPEVVSQAAREGHEIGSHAYSHQFLNKMSRSACEAELDQANQLIYRLTGSQPATFRPPGGAWNDAIALAALERGQTTVLWSVDAGDWRRPPASQVVRTVLDHVKPGSIVLFHDGQPSLPTAEAVGLVIDRLREKGYQFVTVSELLQLQEVRH